MKFCLTIILFSCLIEKIFVESHSWIACTDYAEKFGKEWDPNKCRGFARSAHKKIPKTGVFGGDTGTEGYTLIYFARLGQLVIMNVPWKHLVVDRVVQILQCMIQIYFYTVCLPNYFVKHPYVICECVFSVYIHRLFTKIYKIGYSIESISLRFWLHSEWRQRLPKPQKRRDWIQLRSSDGSLLSWGTGRVGPSYEGIVQYMMLEMVAQSVRMRQDPSFMLLSLLSMFLLTVCDTKYKHAVDLLIPSLVKKFMLLLSCLFAYSY